MQRLALALGLFACLALIAPAAAQSAGPVDITLTATDQSDLLAVCVLAMRSQQAPDIDTTISLGAFCARLRETINEAKRKAAAKPNPEPSEKP